MEFVLVPGGTFQMGDSPLHRVTLPTPFLIARTHCTQASYEKITGSNPSNFEGATLPVESVSWKDAKAFCDKTGLELPVETQWEYACRAGTTTAYSFGDSAASLGEYAWYSENADEATHPVGEKKPNAFGLYDMHGDVYDWSGEWPADQPRAVLIPRDPSGATYRVFRGSSWHDSAEYAHSEQQGYGPPNDGSFQIGFRPAKTVPMD
jgi:formylglycine-generating enzyme required for sulfatase activity